MLTATFTTTPTFNQGIAGLIYDCGLKPRVVVRKETGELIKTLVRITPAAKAAKIVDDITRKFEFQRHEVKSPGAGTQGKNGVEWIGVDRNFLTGIYPANDKRKASVEELKQLSYRITKRGRIRTDFRHAHKHQKILILQQILTREATVRKLAQAKKKNRGRLKAGWLVSVFKGIIQLSGAYLPPQWVTVHAPGAAGSYINGTLTGDKPTFTIINTARGVGSNRVHTLIKSALRVRAKAMQANALLFMKGKKNLADYAR